jgi:hypothetical protein
MRYLLFVFRDFYPKGGAEDFIGSCESLADLSQQDICEVFSQFAGEDQLRANILDCETLKVVKHFSDGRWFTPEEYREYREEY